MVHRAGQSVISEVNGRVATEGHPYKTLRKFVVGVALRGHPFVELLLVA